MNFHGNDLRNTVDLVECLSMSSSVTRIMIIIAVTIT